MSGRSTRGAKSLTIGVSEPSMQSVLCGHFERNQAIRPVGCRALTYPSEMAVLVQKR